MIQPPLFDVVKASAALECIWSRALERTTEQVKLEWLRLGPGNSHRFGFRWRLRNTATGRYLDAQGTVSRKAIALLGTLSSRSKAAIPQLADAFVEEAGDMVSLLAYGLEMPSHEWTRPRRRRPADS